MSIGVIFIIILVIGILIPDPKCGTCKETMSRVGTGGMETEAVFVCDKCD